MHPVVVLPILELTKQFVRRAVSCGGTAIDGTVGTGQDTQFLADLVGASGHVYGFDIQDAALDKARQRLGDLAERVTLYHAGHECVADMVPAEVHGHVQAAMFNLGYLPGGDKTLVTQAEATVRALAATLPMLQPHGILTVHVYTGHDGGELEGRVVSAWAATLPWSHYRVARYDFCNKGWNGEALLAVERLA